MKRFKVGGCRPEAAATLLEAGSAIPERQRPEKSGDALLPQWPEIAEEGGLVAYGPRFITLYRQHALQAVKVLKAHHESVSPSTPERWDRPEPLKAPLESPDASREEGSEGSGMISAPVVGGFFSTGVGLLTASHMPVETAQ